MNKKKYGQKFYILIVLMFTLIFSTTVFASSLINTDTSNKIITESKTTKTLTIPTTPDVKLEKPISIERNGTLNYVAKFVSNRNMTIGNSSIFDNGNVGIGTIKPSAKLTIQDGNYFPQLYILNNIGASGSFYVDPNSNFFRIEASNCPDDFCVVMPITLSGNVGIGTTTPNQKLEVDGGIRLNTADRKPDCNADTRGTLWTTLGDVGIADNTEICRKNANGYYSWVTIY